MKKISVIFSLALLMFIILASSVYASDCEHVWSDWKETETENVLVRTCLNCKSVHQTANVEISNIASTLQYAVTGGTYGGANIPAIYDGVKEGESGALIAWCPRGNGNDYYITVTATDGAEFYVKSVASSPNTANIFYTVSGSDEQKAAVGGVIEQNVTSIIIFNGSWGGRSYYEFEIQGQNIVVGDVEEHNYSAVIDPVNANLELLTCNVCGETSSRAHTWNDGVVTLEPTATTPGSKLYSCLTCTATKTEEIAALGHTWDSGTVVAPTCTEEGYTIYKCTDAGCDATYRDNTVMALGHDLDDGAVTLAATINHAGERLLTCKRDCGYTETRVIPQLTWDDITSIITKDDIASATATGSAQNSSCNVDFLIDGVISQSTNYWTAPKGNSATIILKEEVKILEFGFYGWSNWNGIKFEFYDANDNKVAEYNNGGYQVVDDSITTIADAANKRVIKIVCTVTPKNDGDGSGNIRITELVIKAHKCIDDGNHYDVTEATCKEGSYKYKCTQCEEEREIILPSVSEHSYALESIAYVNGFDAAGVKNYKCSVCGDTKTESAYAIFEAKGYSVKEDGTAIMGGFAINIAARDEYKAASGAEMKYGVIFANVSDGNDLTFDSNNVLTNPKAIQIGVEDEEYGMFKYVLSGFNSGNKDLSIVITAFVINNGDISFVQAKDVDGNGFEYKSYLNGNSIGIVNFNDVYSCSEYGKEE